MKYVVYVVAITRIDGKNATLVKARVGEAKDLDQAVVIRENGKYNAPFKERIMALARDLAMGSTVVLTFEIAFE